MMSFTADGQVDLEISRQLQLKVDGVDMATRRKWREKIPEPKVHPSTSHFKSF
jgi:hypothetical protein